MHKAHNALTQRRAQVFKPFFRGRQIQNLAFIHQRADPIGLFTFVNSLSQALDHLRDPFVRHHHRLNRLPPRRFFIQHRNIHIAILRQCQRARDWRRRHHQDIGCRAFFAQLQPLPHAKAMLFINDCEPQVFEIHIRLKHRMGAHQNMDVPPFQRRQFRRAVFTFVAPR